MAHWMFSRGLPILLLIIATPVVIGGLYYGVKGLWQDFHDEELWKEEKWG
jgi:hypothetical protein